MIIPDPAAFVNAGRASEKRGRKRAFPVASAGRVWYNVEKVAGNGGRIDEIVGRNQDDASTVSNCYYLRSTDEDTNPAAKSAEEFADGTVLAALIAGRDSAAHPWNSACRYLTAAGRTLPVFKGQGDAHTHDWSKWTSNGDGTHTHRCACGVSETVSCSGAAKNNPTGGPPTGAPPVRLPLGPGGAFFCLTADFFLATDTHMGILYIVRLPRPRGRRAGTAGEGQSHRL